MGQTAKTRRGRSDVERQRLHDGVASDSSGYQATAISLTTPISRTFTASTRSRAAT